MLLLVMSFSYTPRADFSEEFLLPHAMFIKLILVRSSSYAPEACLQRGVSLTLLMLVFVRGFHLTPRVIFSEEFLIHSPYWFSLVRSFSYLMLCLFVGSFSYTPDATFSQEFLLNTSCYIYS